MNYLGDFPANGKVFMLWNTNGADGASITRATDGTITIYKGNTTVNTWKTQRSSSAGITDTEDFDTLTGLHALSIDLSDNTDAGFYAAGNEYEIAIVGAVIDGKTVNSVIGEFSIERNGGALALIKSYLMNYAVTTGSVVADGSNAAATFKTDLSSATDNYYKDAWITLTSGAMAGQVKKITGYSGSTKFITVFGGFTAAPAAGVTFTLVNR